MHNAHLFFLCQHSAWSRWASQHWWCLGSHGPWFSLSLVSLVCLVLCWWPAGTVVWANLQVALDPWLLAYCAVGIVPGFLDPNPGPAAWAGAVLGPVLLLIGWAFHQLGQIHTAWWPWLVTPWWSPILVICGTMAILVHIWSFHGISHGWLAIVWSTVCWVLAGFELIGHRKYGTIWKALIDHNCYSESTVCCGLQTNANWMAA